MQELREGGGVGAQPPRRVAVQGQFQKDPPVAFLLPQRQAGEQVAQGFGDRQVALGVGGHPRRLRARKIIPRIDWRQAPNRH